MMEIMYRADRCRARDCFAPIWISIVLGSLMNAGCALPSPAGRQPDQRLAEFGTRMPPIEPVAGEPRVHVSGPTATRPESRSVPAVQPASFQDVREAPSPPPDEFRMLTEPLPVHSMTFEEVLQQTLDHHPLLQARAHEIQEARGRLITAGLLENPQWVMDSETPVDEDDVTVLSTRLTFTVPTARKRRRAMEAADAGVAKSCAALALETELVLAEAADAAIEVLYLQELAGMQGQLSQLAATTAEVVRGQFRAGGADYPDTIKARLDAAEIELKRRETLTELDLARVRLTRAAGLPPSELVQMQGELRVEPLPALPLERVLAAAESSRPDLAASRAALLESQRLHAQARAEARPDLEFGPRMQNNLGETGDRLGARLSVDLPLFDRNQGDIAESAAAVRTQRAMLQATEVNTLNDVAAAYLELRNAQMRWDFHHTHVQPLIEQSHAAIRDAAAGKVLAPADVSQLLEQMAAMQVQQLELRYVHVRLRTRLEILLGCPLDEIPAL